METLAILCMIAAPIEAMIIIGLLALLYRGDVERDDGSIANRAQERQEARGRF